MSHRLQLEFVEITKSLFPEMFRGQKVLEIGSLDINGNVRSFFEDCSYTGIDVAPGPGVDVVCEGQKYDGLSSSFDVVISCEVMEHNPYWAETLTNMIRLLRPGGLMVMSCATIGRKEHGTTRSDTGASPLTVQKGWDYYRNLTSKDIRRAVDLCPLSHWGFVTNWEGYDLYFLGVKAGSGIDASSQIKKFKSTYWRRIISGQYSRIRWVVREPSRIVIFLKRILKRSPTKY
jgi:SAM-dependent methyltransferase